MTPAERSLLITGGAGFIGANFVHHWLRTQRGGRLVVLDKLTYAGNEHSLDDVKCDPRFRFVRGDINDIDLVAAILHDEAIDTVVHFAAESHVDRSIAAPDVFLETNVLGTHALLKAARERWEALAEPERSRFRFHHVSTDEVFGSLQKQDPAFTERTAYAPNSPYSASKAASDHLVRAYHRTFGLPVTTSNSSNNYGPFQFPEKLIPLLLTNALQGKPLPVYGDGLNRRDWLHVEDHCRGIALVLERGCVGETYNIGGNAETANIDLVRAFCQRLDDRFAADPALKVRFPNAPASTGVRTASLITFVTDRLGHDRRYSIDASRATAELGYKPERDLERGLDETVAWYLDHEEWWRPLLDRT